MEPNISQVECVVAEIFRTGASPATLIGKSGVTAHAEYAAFLLLSLGVEPDFDFDPDVVAVMQRLESMASIGTSVIETIRRECP